MEEQTTDKTDEQSFDHELAGKYLTVSLADETYGVPISPIEDIIEMKDITSVPQTSEFLEGVINLRGSVIPVLDLRKKFQVEVSDYDRKTCIVVVKLDGILTGLIVDRVYEVIDLGDEQIDPAPNMSQQIKTRFIAGMGKRDDDVIILLNLEKVLQEEEKKDLEELAEEQPV
ncbi:MAG: chemotaxis protein CheW [bacterium]